MKLRYRRRVLFSLFGQKSICALLLRSSSLRGLPYLRGDLRAFTGPSVEDSVSDSNAVRLPLPADHDMQKEIAKLHTKKGLICLERSIPGQVLLELDALAQTTTPFKREALRGRALWIQHLMEPLLLAQAPIWSAHEYDDNPASVTFCSAANGKMHTGQYTTTSTSMSPTQESLKGNQLWNSLQWLTADIASVSGLFQNVTLPTDNGAQSSAISGEEHSGITVKLELLTKGKCPRFHLDKVQSRLICTYVGPSTEWIDGYDPVEMQHNRQAPPACNTKISGGREIHRASTGEALLFRGKTAEAPQELPVAHRSPDMDERQRRLVLTVDVGDIVSPSSDIPP